MKNGKVSQSILKRSVLRQLHREPSDGVLTRPEVGIDAADIQIGEEDTISLALNPITLNLSDLSDYAQLGVFSALNNIAAAGAQPRGILVSVLIPTLWNEQQLRILMKEIDQAAQQAGVSVLGGHTQVTRVVKNAVLMVTGIGKGNTAARLTPQSIQPGMDLLVTKWVALEGTALLAKEREKELQTRYAQPFIDKAKKFSGYLSILSEAAVAAKSGVCAMHDVSEGGIFGALWEMAEAAGVGLDIDLKKIPIRQETIEICEFFDLNPYKLLSSGSLLLAAQDGNRIVREIEKAGGTACIIGTATDSNDRVLIQGGERRFLEVAQTDEIYKII